MTDFINLKQRLSQSFCPVWILYGNDAWVKARALELITNSLNINFADFNITTLENTKDVDQLFTLSAIAPMSDDVRLTIADDFQVPQGNKLNDFRKRLQNFATLTDNSACLVFVCNDSCDAYLNIKGVEYVNCNKLNENTVVKWIVAFCKKNTKAITDNTARMLAQYCLNDMARISTELQKLCDAVNLEITVDTVEQLVKKDSEYVVFDLGKVIALRNANKALDMLDNLLSCGEEVRSLFTLLYNYYRRLYYIKTTKYTDEQLAKYLGVKARAITYARQIADKYKPMQLRNTLKLFLTADNRIKDFCNENDVLKTLILQLCNV